MRFLRVSRREPRRKTPTPFRSSRRAAIRSAERSSSRSMTPGQRHAQRCQTFSASWATTASFSRRRWGPAFSANLASPARWRGRRRRVAFVHPVDDVDVGTARVAEPRVGPTRDYSFVGPVARRRATASGAKLAIARSSSTAPVNAAPPSGASADVRVLRSTVHVVVGATPLVYVLGLAR